MCRKAKYILQKLTSKINQSAIQLTINQLSQKLKNRNTNKQALKWPRALTAQTKN
jgi:hypothetical protein